MTGFAERRTHPRTRVVSSDAEVLISLGGVGHAGRVVDWSPSGLLLRVEGRRTVRRALDSLLLTGDHTPCRLQLDPLVSEGRLRASVVRAKRRSGDALHLGIRFDEGSTPSDCLRRWARWLGELSIQTPSSATGRHETQRLSKEELPTHAPTAEAERATRRLPRTSARASAVSARGSCRVAEAGTAVLPAPPRPSARLEPLPKDGDPFVGHIIGPCLVQERVGEGTFGRVYRAIHLRLQQPVALKLLARATVKGNELSRFQLEAKAAASLSDPNVAKVFELGEDVEGRPFIVQELVEGETLHSRVERMGPLPLDEVAKLGAGIASGLLSIHRANMVHRDLKPENVMITSEDEPKIVDFGLVRRVGDEAEFTPEGLLLGTPAFLAPEQIERREAGHAREADLYALGCVLFYALTGRVPHMEEDPSGETLTVFLYRRLSTAAPDVRQLRAGVPEPLARLVGSLLSSEPSQRCTANQAQSILAEFSAGYEEAAPVQAMKGSSGRRRVPSSSGRVRGVRSSRRVKAVGSRRSSSRHTKRTAGSSTRLDVHTPSRRVRRANAAGSGRGRATPASTGPAVVAGVALACMVMISLVLMIAGGDGVERAPGRVSAAATAEAPASAPALVSAEDQAMERMNGCDPEARPGEALRLARGVLRAFPRGPVANRAQRLRTEANRCLQVDCDRVLQEVNHLVQQGRWAAALDELTRAQVRHSEEASTDGRLKQRKKLIYQRLTEALNADMLRIEAALLDDEPAQAGSLFAAALDAYGKKQVQVEVTARLAASGMLSDQRVHAALEQLASTMLESRHRVEGD